MGIKAFFKKISTVTSEMLFPDVCCLSCGAELNGITKYNLCLDCQVEINKFFCDRCGRHKEDTAQFCDRCIEHGEYHFEFARSSVVFNQSTQRLIHKLKYGDAKYLIDHFVPFLIDTAEENKLAPDIVTFVPLHKKRRKQRGYNQAELLAKAFCEKKGLECKALLEKTQHTKNLTRLTRKEREEHIANTFAFIGEKNEIKNKSVLLIDDVFTTGTTANECAKVLKKAGAEKVLVLSFASVACKGYAKADDKTGDASRKKFP
ncbi:MAG: ComF family protein [Firmicutes bacterium]|nr:ComF family protein [Bacillota bacterium]